MSTYPQRFTRVSIPVYVEQTDEGSNDPEVRENYQAIESMSDKELLEMAVENMRDGSVSDYFGQDFLVEWGFYSEDGEHVIRSRKINFEDLGE